MIELTTYQLQTICNLAAEAAVRRFAKQMGIDLKDSISKRQAVKEFGLANLERWQQCGFIKVERKGLGPNSKITYSRSQIQSIKELEESF